MPTYEYKCEACGHGFEKFQSITAAPIKKCPECGKNKVKRLIGTGAGLIFKGSGFYITDYRSEGYKKAASAESGSGSSSSGSSSNGSASGGSSNNTAGTSSSSSSAPSSTPPASSPTPAKSEAKPAAKKK